MPIFEFHCPKCDRDFEDLVRSATEANGVKCPSCGARDVGRKLSTFSARSADGAASAPLPVGGCGRCGDPSGPCGM